MNFFKSVFTDEPTPLDSPKSSPDSPSYDSPEPNPTWSLGGLIKTLATKSESIIENYHKDFEEFGSGLRKETAVIREVASRAVKDLPASLEVGASVAQESLETVGQAINDIGGTVWKSTPHIISQGRDSILPPDHDDSNSSGKYYRNSEQRSLNVKRYSRFDMQVRAIQCDLNTYCNEPEDKVEYDQWRLGCFSMEEKRVEIDNLFNENEVIQEIYNEAVPSRVDDEGFWNRYFYKLHKLKQAEDARALLVKRAISSGDEDLRWDFDDEDEKDDRSNNKSLSEGQSSGNNAVKSTDGGLVKDNTSERSGNAMENVTEENLDNVKLDKCEEMGRNCDSCEDSDVTVVSSQSLPEEDLGWDEIEEIGSSNDEKQGEAVGSRTSNKANECCRGRGGPELGYRR